MSASEVAAAYLFDISGDNQSLLSSTDVNSGASGTSGPYSSGVILPNAFSDMQIGWIQTPNQYTTEGGPVPLFNLSTEGTNLGWIQSSSGTSDYLSLDVSFQMPDTTSSQAYESRFGSHSPSWSSGIATIKAA
jgi:hypothetical protein